MAAQSKFKQFLFSKINVGRTLRESFEFVAGFVGYDISGDSDARRIRFAVNTLVRRLLEKDGRIAPERRDICRRLWEEHFDHAYAETRLQELMETAVAPADEAVAVLSSLPDIQRQQIADFLLALAVALGNLPDEVKFVFDTAVGLGVDLNALEKHHMQLEEEARKRKLLVSSGWGVVVAIGVILLFVITAKLLQSVIFGLIIGCVLLPLEKMAEKQLRRKRGVFYIISAIGSTIFYPLYKVSHLLNRTAGDTPKDENKISEQRLIRKAVIVTALSSVIVIFAVGLGISKFAGHHMRNLRSTIVEHTASGERSQKLAEFSHNLDNWKVKFEALPAVKSTLEFAGRVINDPDTRRELGGELLKRSGGMMKITADIFSAVTAFFANLLMTIFFGLLFLFKLAEFCRDDDSDKSKSEYVVRTIFNGIWLPGADDAVISEARRIIEGVFFRLRVWLKGYITLVIVDSTVYTTIFFFMRLPFFWLLGIIAGCGILLPYLGPVISCAITLLVTLAMGGSSGSVFFGIIIAYLIYNGIVEQFILYPAVIGDALGLSTLETIIVVLLGAIFAGIP
ncbi:MAG: AI-2E family transporter, partial [Lentisphaeria bacterium]|nr:AI-2E family transporter [Lentisphaeria bacterium]